MLIVNVTCSKISLKLSSGNLADAAAFRSGTLSSFSMMVGSKQVSPEHTRKASSVAGCSVVLLKKVAKFSSLIKMFV